MTPTVKVTGDICDGVRYAVLDSNVPLPAKLFDVDGVHGGTYFARVRLAPLPVFKNGVRVTTTTPDFVKLGVVLDMVRGTGAEVDLSKVPGWRDKGIGF